MAGRAAVVHISNPSAATGAPKGDNTTLKQNSWDTVRVWWAPILSRGKLHIEILGPDFPGDTPEGASILVPKVRGSVNIRFHGDKPDVVFTDRGRGFFAIKSGKITKKYKEALEANGFTAFMGQEIVFNLWLEHVDERRPPPLLYPRGAPRNQSSQAHHSTYISISARMLSVLILLDGFCLGRPFRG